MPKSCFISLNHPYHSGTATLPGDSFNCSQQGSFHISLRGVTLIGVILQTSLLNSWLQCLLFHVCTMGPSKVLCESFCLRFLLSMLSTGSIVAYSSAVKIEASGRRLQLMMWPLQWWRNLTNCSNLQPPLYIWVALFSGVQSLPEFLLFNSIFL